MEGKISGFAARFVLEVLKQLIWKDMKGSQLESFSRIQKKDPRSQCAAARFGKRHGHQT